MRRVAVLVVVCACGGRPAIFPEDYAATYQEVRNCRASLEHEATIRVLVSPEAVDAYTGRMAAFPVGSIVLKEEYLVSDTMCAREPIRFTAMRKLSPGTSPGELDWEWQETDRDLHDSQDDTMPCVTCHEVCGKAPVGYDGTCTDP